MRTKHKIMEVLKRFAPKRYDAWEMANILQMQSKEKFIERLLLTLSRDYKNIHLDKTINSIKYYYEKRCGSDASL